MSRKIVDLVYSRRVGSQARKAILAYCADRASDDGSGIWSSKHTIARATEAGLTTVKREMRALEDSGILIRTGIRPCDRGETVVYRLDIGAVSALPKVEREPKTRGARVDPVHSGPGPERDGGHSGPSTGATVAPKPSYQPSLVVVVGAQQDEGGHSGPRPDRPPSDNLPDQLFGDDDLSLRERVMAACRVRDFPLSKYWMPPNADVHVHSWVRDLKLTEEQIIGAATAAAEHHDDPPKGPKALDDVMQRYAAELQKPALQPKGQANGKSSRHDEKRKYDEAVAAARQAVAGNSDTSVLAGPFAPGASRRR